MLGHVIAEDLVLGIMLGAAQIFILQRRAFIAIFAQYLFAFEKPFEKCHVILPFFPLSLLSARAETREDPRHLFLIGVLYRFHIFIEALQSSLPGGLFCLAGFLRNREQFIDEVDKCQSVGVAQGLSVLYIVDEEIDIGRLLLTSRARFAQFAGERLG